MKAVLILLDSLNRGALSCYGGSVPTPSFDRLASQGVRFDKHFVGSLPCMPARRDLMTGRLGFMHRSWGPLEPFDDNFPEILRSNGIYCHLATDHYHYFQDGGSTYHNRYSSFEFFRGQESDHWVADVNPNFEELKKSTHAIQFEDHRDGHRLQGAVNRTKLLTEGDYSIVKCFDAGLNFLKDNGNEDNWLLQIETFDPHEPFIAPKRYRDMFQSQYTGPTLDWPRYRSVSESPSEIEELRNNYLALVKFSDDQLGRLLDDFDSNGRWDDTALILTTDHGLLLGEHGWWGKNQMPIFNEIANIPLLICHPELRGRSGQSCNALTQTTDIMSTILDIFGISSPKDCTGSSILPLMFEKSEKIRDFAIYGIYAGAVNATDGVHTYFRYPKSMISDGMFEYTLMPMHNYSMFETKELKNMELHPGFDFTKSVQVLKIPALPDAKRSPRQGGFYDTNSRLFNLVNDPLQNSPFRDEEIEKQFCARIFMEMKRHDAPSELYDRWELEQPDANRIT